MNIVWLSWKDSKHPEAGGAERVKTEICRRLIRDGHSVIQLTALYPGARSEDVIEGSSIVRFGNKFTVYWYARRYYKENLREWADIVIDECNTVPFFAGFYAKEKSVMVIYQLARQIWFYQMIFPLNLIGYLLEPFYLWLLRKSKVITICESTRNELMQMGFQDKLISIIPMATDTLPLEVLNAKNSQETPLVLYFGSMRKMKRPDHVIKAFLLAKKCIPGLQLILAGGGNGSYLVRLKNLIKSSTHSDSISYLGAVSAEEKIALMRRANILAVTSVKEGWGLVVTEAAAQGTPAVVYDVDGLRDSVKNEVTGLLTNCNPSELAEGMVKILLDIRLYNRCRFAGWTWAKELNFENTYNNFCSSLKIK